MRMIDVHGLEIPASVRKALDKGQVEALAFYAVPLGQRRQERFEFKALKLPALRDWFRSIFHSKCAYCESELSATGHGGVANYRPKSGVMEDPTHPGYWWIAYDIENLVFACTACTAAKRTRFPLQDDGRRAMSPTSQLDKEFPLLLSPYSLDLDIHLIFEESGHVTATSTQGHTTIAVLDLNRSGLVLARRSQAERVEILVNTINATATGQHYNSELNKSLQNLIAQLSDMIKPSHPYSVANRHFITRFAKRFNLPQQYIPDYLKTASIHTDSEQVEARQEHNKFIAEQSQYSLNQGLDLEKYRLQSRSVESITISNIRAIDQLHIRMGSSPAEAGGWMVLLGENGTGKTTVLRAIAAALAGTDACASLIKQGLLVPSEFVRTRCKSGHVKVKISGFPQAHELVFRADSLRFTNGIGEVTELAVKDGKSKRTGRRIEPPTILLAYGATRLAPGRSHAHDERIFRQAARIDNLFNPFCPLINSSVWLRSLNSKRFAQVSFILRDLLCLPSTAKFSRRHDEVRVRMHDITLPLGQLSDGYRSMIALTIDILKTASQIWPNLTDAEGIVLLDEIGTHLHPRWQMRVVGSLRRALPGIQFIVTTHDPLCLRGVGKGEVMVIQRDVDGSIQTLADLPSPGDFRVEQLLTSSFFGLDSTSDPETEDLFNEYYALLATRKPNAEERQRLAELKKELNGRQLLGDTPREQALYRIIDKTLAERRNEGRRSLPKLDDRETATFANMWKDTLAKAKKTI